MQFTKATAKRFIPDPILRFVGQHQMNALRRKFERMDRRQAFSEIYRHHHWGRSFEGPFCSGDGSCDRFADDYCDIIKRYISNEKISSVVDLGCGDFRIGRRVSSFAAQYCGVDVVTDLIAFNSKHYGTERIHFKCLDIVDDPLPIAELCLIRQVLQHLNNSEIGLLLKKVIRYPHVIITEHLPSLGNLKYVNRDKPHGPDTRLTDGSGVFIAAPPFRCKAVATYELPYDERTSLVTSVLRNV